MLLLNYRPVLHQPTGIGIYANAVLPALQDFDHYFISGGGIGGGQDRLKRLAWSQFQLPRIARKRHADLIFTPAPEGYLGEQDVPQVVMVHDLRPLSHPDLSLQSLYFRSWVPYLIRNCRHIITNSRFTASEVSSTLAVSQDKITIIPLGYDSSHFYSSPLNLSPHHRPYLLHVGQAYPHKNLQRLIYSFNAISRRFPELDLLLLGKPHPTESTRLQKLVLELGLSQRVLFKRYVPYSDLPNWYRGALAFVYPSLWEGFGLPILEAMACGCPVITSLGTGTQETALSSAQLIDPFSCTDLTAAITEIVTSSSIRESLIALGYTRIKDFSWSECRHQTRILFDKLLS